MEDWKEAIDDFLGDGQFFIEKSDLIYADVRRFKIFRDDKSDIVIEVTYDGFQRNGAAGPPAGTLSASNGTILFRDKYLGGTGQARGVVSRSSHSSGESGRMETVERFTAHTIDLDIDVEAEETYCVEYIDNLSSSYLWPEMIDTETMKSTVTKIDWKDDSIRIPISSKISGGARAALHLKLRDFDLVICKDSREKRERSGKIVYRGLPDPDFRDQVRDVVSFVLGRPIVYYGFTTFSQGWTPCKSHSRDAYTINGMMFGLHALAPYPICSRSSRNMLDGMLVQHVCGALLDNYDRLDFQRASWAYWHARCAPYHMEAAHFGALVEKIQGAVANAVLAKDERRLFKAKAWDKFRLKLLELIADTDIAPENRTKVLQAVENLGRVPQPVVMHRLFQRLGAPLGPVEDRAWRQRNMAAHGIMKDDYVPILLNNKALRLIVHRMIAGITGCSTHYIDYYNLNFPVRALVDPLPERPS